MARNGTPVKGPGGRWGTSDGVPLPVDPEPGSVPVIYPDAPPLETAAPPHIQQLAAEIARQMGGSGAGARWKRLGIELGVIVAVLALVTQVFGWGRASADYAQADDVAAAQKEDDGRLKTLEVTVPMVLQRLDQIDGRLGKIEASVSRSP